jgi:sugar/nucleoside kinase (ribokinase family)
MLNVYLDKKREKRDSKALSVAKNFTINDFQKCVKRPAKLIHFAGLLHGDFDNNIYEYCSHFNSKISVDAQTLLRHIKKDGTIYYKDFAQKNKIFKYIDCLKVGEYESYILTNETDIKKSAYKIANLGVKEIFFVTKNKLIVFYNSQFCSFKLKPKSLIGRTGRGDTAFASYIHKRINNNVKESLLFSAALLSLKLESIGAFANTEQNVLDFISMHY